MQKNKLTLYDVQWQALRVSLLTRWVTVNGTYENLKKLDLYVTNSGELYSSEYCSRLWRVLNLLNATRRAFHGLGLVGTIQDEAIIRFRDKISKEYEKVRKMLVDYADVTEQDVKEGWAQLSEGQRAAIIKNLDTRLSAHSESKHRGELRWFLNIVKAL